ncbi:amino acid ABC transporter permease [Planctomycetota bacterium]
MPRVSLTGFLRGGSGRRLSVALFFLMVLAFGLGLHYAFRTVDYEWRWQRVPQYFCFLETTEIRSELEGEVVSLASEDAALVITVRGEQDQETYRVPEASARVTEGRYVYPGDLLGAHSEWRVGVLLQGLWMTLKVSAIAVLLGTVIGLFTGLARISDNPALRWSAMAYIELIRGSPLLVQIFIWYFVLGDMINKVLSSQGIGQPSPLWYGVAALAVFAGAYVAEIVRAGIQSVHRGQMEAARSLGMAYGQAMRHIILPQAIRRILPPLAGQFISLIKDSSLLGIIAIRELTKATREVVATSLMPFELWFLCAGLYLILTFSLSMFVQYLERRLSVS